MDFEKELERIVEGPGTKADRARALFALGCDRTDVVELLTMSYSQAHQLWKAVKNGTAQDGSKPRVREVRQESEAVGERTDTRVSGRVQRDRGRGRGPSPLRLSPAQTRVLTQDGHRVVRVDYDGGPLCRNCKDPVTFSLAWLGFVHTRSTADPTGLEDNYA